MSSKIEVIKRCEYCDNDFIAKTSVTKFCSHIFEEAYIMT